MEKDDSEKKLNDRLIGVLDDISLEGVKFSKN